LGIRTVGEDLKSQIPRLLMRFGIDRALEEES
jgi:hypothetical protein